MASASLLFTDLLNLIRIFKDTVDLSRHMPSLREFKAAFYVSSNLAGNIESLSRTIGDLPPTIRHIVLRFASKVHNDKMDIPWNTLETRIESRRFQGLESVTIMLDVEGLSPVKKEVELKKLRSLKLYQRGLLSIEG